MIEYVFPVVVGALIGWFTNKVAIKMIFRPLRAHYLFGYKIPFTPGIIPKGHDRIARSIGNIGENLVKIESIKETLLSDNILGRINAYIDDFIIRQTKNGETLREFIAHAVPADVINELILNTKDDMAAELNRMLNNSEFINSVSDKIIEHVELKINSLDILGLGVFASLTGIQRRINSYLRNSIRKVLRDNIRSIIENNAEGIVYSICNKGINKVMSIPVCNIVNEQRSSIDAFKEYLINGYKKGVDKYLPRIVENINISKIVEKSVLELDVLEVEKLLLDVIANELRWIEVFGAILGGLIGILNIFV
ncbi:MAG: DUF445 family protein [Bacteroidaceae bacterium]|nr:DUF445 family protein [Bacteroidaceae bacterium]